MIFVGLFMPAYKAQSTPILTYHDIITKRDNSSVWFDCTVSEFKEQIEYFEKRKANFVSIEQIYQALNDKKPLPANSICITFADNYLGFYRHAWPIVKGKRIPVAQFVHTDFVGSKTGRPKMTWNQLQELDRSGLVTIGSQTCSHPADLTKLSSLLLSKEFSNSKRTLEQKLNHPVTALAYPNGKYDARVSEAAQAANYRIAFTEVLLPAEKAPNLFEVPRWVHTKYRQAWKLSHP